MLIILPGLLYPQTVLQALVTQSQPSEVSCCLECSSGQMLSPLALRSPWRSLSSRTCEGLLSSGQHSPLVTQTLRHPPWGMVLEAVDTAKGCPHLVPAYWLHAC